MCLTDEPTDILYRLGEGHRVVGISAYTKYPVEAVAEKPKVTGFSNGSVKKIAALEPDLVIGFSEIQAALAAKLIAIGLPVMIFNQRSVAGILDAIVAISRLVGAEERGQRLARLCEERVERVRARRAGEERRPRVYFEEWHDPIITGIRWVSELIEVAGGVDVFASLRDRKMAHDRVVTEAEVRAAEPDVVLASWCGKPFDRQAFEAREGFAALPAVRAGRVFEVDGSLVLQPGPTCILEGLPLIERLLWEPELNEGD